MRQGRLPTRARLARAAVAVSLIGAALGADASGQRPVEATGQLALTGLRTVAARVSVEWDMAVTMRGGVTRSDFERDLVAAFSSALAATPVTLDDAAGDRLDCVVGLTYLEDGDRRVVVVRTVRLLRPEGVPEALAGWAVVWSRGRTITTARGALSGSRLGRECAAVFDEDWRRANPGY